MMMVAGRTFLSLRVLRTVRSVQEGPGVVFNDEQDDLGLARIPQGIGPTGRAMVNP